MAKRIRRPVVVMILAALLAVPAAAQTPEPAEEAGAPAAASKPVGALVAPGDSPTLELLYSGNVIGYIEPCG